MLGVVNTEQKTIREWASRKIGSGSRPLGEKVVTSAQRGGQLGVCRPVAAAVLEPAVRDPAIGDDERARARMLAAGHEQAPCLGRGERGVGVERDVRQAGLEARGLGDLVGRDRDHADPAGGELARVLVQLTEPVDARVSIEAAAEHHDRLRVRGDRLRERRGRARRRQDLRVGR